MMARTIRSALITTVAASGLLPFFPEGLVRAGDVSTRHQVAFSTPQFNAEIFAGYLSSLSRELVYDVPGSGSKLSQLNWQTDGAAVLGGGLSYKASDWLTLRSRAWFSISSDNALDDYDWLLGYSGFESW